MKPKAADHTEQRRPRLKKETLRGLGFDELEAVRGGREEHPRPIGTRYCLTG
jgi:hypothetical protein